MKIKTILIGSAIVFVIILFATISIQIEKIKKQKAEIIRLGENNYQLLADRNNNMTLYLKEKEVTGRLKHERDSMAEALKIKPKTINRIVYIDNYIHDTVKISVPVERLGKNEWMLRDSTKCLKYASKLILKGDSLTAQRQLFEYTNRTTEIYYRKARHIWFIRIGKWTNFVQIDSDCGTIQKKTFDFIR